jgi:hypothetical protein
MRLRSGPRAQVTHAFRKAREIFEDDPRWKVRAAGLGWRLVAPIAMRPNTVYDSLCFKNTLYKGLVSTVLANPGWRLVAPTMWGGRDSWRAPAAVSPRRRCPCFVSCEQRSSALLLVLGQAAPEREREELFHEAQRERDKREKEERKQVRGVPAALQRGPCVCCTMTCLVCTPRNAGLSVPWASLCIRARAEQLGMMRRAHCAGRHTEACFVAPARRSASARPRRSVSCWSASTSRPVASGARCGSWEALPLPGPLPDCGPMPPGAATASPGRNVCDMDVRQLSIWQVAFCRCGVGCCLFAQVSKRLEGEDEYEAMDKVERLEVFQV